MTAKQKAKELVDKMWVYSLPNANGSWNNAKQCALIAVDEIIEECANWAGGSIDDGWDRKRFDYWQEVKQEIKKL